MRRLLSNEPQRRKDAKRAGTRMVRRCVGSTRMNAAPSAALALLRVFASLRFPSLGRLFFRDELVGVEVGGLGAGLDGAGFLVDLDRALPFRRRLPEQRLVLGAVGDQKRQHRVERLGHYGAVALGPMLVG